MERADGKLVMGNKRNKVEFARELRKEQTDTEKRLWWILRDKRFAGYKFRRQYVFRGFIIDFYCSSARLGIEVDGPVHSKQKEYDLERQKVIEANGIKIIRFNNSDVYSQPEMVLCMILDSLSGCPLHNCGEGGPRAKRVVGEVRP